MIAALAALTLALGGCLPSGLPFDLPWSAGDSGSSTDAGSSVGDRDGLASEEATLVEVIDGDTIDTSAGRVRIVGIDTPERGECGYREATELLERLLPEGATVTLVFAEGQNDTDRHGRLLRHVLTADGVDVALRELSEGLAVARYDSTEGYPRHPFEQEYHAAQMAAAAADGSPIPVICDGEEATAGAEAWPDGEWWRQYPSCGALQRSGSGHPTGPFRRDDPTEAAAYEWFAYGTGNNGDGDGDGLACEGGR